MPKRHQERAEETRQAILQAASRLFGQRGYEAVTMREIAREAGCSHTAIYLYFKDKEALLYHLAIGPLKELEAELEATLRDGSLAPGARVAAMGRAFIRFGLTHRNSYQVLFIARAERVDEETPDLPINALRNHLFGMLRQAVADFLPPGTPADVALAYTRVVFFHLHGIVETYREGEGDLPALTDRLGATFELSLDVLLSGIEQTARRA